MTPRLPPAGGEAPPRPVRGALEPDPHVLVVEDDGEVRHLLARLLRENGFAVSAARDGREMREVLANAAPPVDLVLLDVMLPGASGMDLLREIRATSRLPVVMLTARGEETDRVLGLEFGADDYVTKPFGRRELVARLRAVLRRVRGGDPDAAGQPAEAPHAAGGGRLLRFAGWTLDTGRRELVSPAGAAVDLSGAEYDLLMAFLAHPQRVLGRDQLLEVGRRRFGDAFDRTVDVQVSRLRRKIEPDESAAPLIKTVRGAGYVFVAPVERA
ncbi:response regulator transcription factor [Craurococcus roseus]